MKGPSHQSQEVSHLITQAYQNVKHYREPEAPVWAQAFAMTYNLTQGINKFGEKGREAATAEMKQLHDRKCFRPIKVENLSEQQRARALELLIFLTEKRLAESRPEHVLMEANRSSG